MTDSRTAVAEFLHQFIGNTNQGDARTQAPPFAATFLAAGPNGAQCMRREDFLLALAKRKEMFASAGLRRTELAGVEVEALDARYSKARAEWKMGFEDGTEAAQEITVASTYIIDTGVQPFEIVLYMAHQEIAAILKERKLLRD